MSEKRYGCTDQRCMYENANPQAGEAQIADGFVPAESDVFRFLTGVPDKQ